jgi:uncharacterized membrane protein
MPGSPLSGSRLTGSASMWPPPDTDRNRFVFRVGFVLGVLATAYVMTFAMVSGGWLPITVAVLLLAGTLLLGIGLLLMRAQRRAVSPRRPRSSPTAR